MSDRRRFFSEDWATVADFRIALDPRISADRHRYRGQGWYALSDPVSGRVFRLSKPAYLFVAHLDGRHSVADIWQKLVDRFGEDAQSQEQVISLLGQLSHADFIQNRGISPVIEEIETRRRKRANSLVMRNLLGQCRFAFHFMIRTTC